MSAEQEFSMVSLVREKMLVRPPERLSLAQLAQLLWASDYIPLLLLELSQYREVAVRSQRSNQLDASTVWVSHNASHDACAGTGVCSRAWTT